MSSQSPRNHDIVDFRDESAINNSQTSDSEINLNNEIRHGLELLSQSVKKIEDFLIIKNRENSIYNENRISENQKLFKEWVKEDYKRRMLRSNFFNEAYFEGEPSWNMILDLANARIEGKKISITSACIASGAPPTTALRWIAILEEDGIITKENDLSDRRRTFVKLSDKGMKLLEEYFRSISSFII